MNALKSQNLTPYPLEANILPFPGLKPQWTYDGTSFTSILLIGLGLALIPGGFAIDVVALRQVSYILEAGGGWVRLVQSRAGRKKGGRKQGPILPQGNKVFFKVREKSALRSSFQLLPRYTVNFYVKSTRYIACTEIQKTTEGEKAEGKVEGKVLILILPSAHARTSKALI